MARIFISHSSKNNAQALAIREWLVSQGWTDLFLDIHPVDGIVAAERWQNALRSSIGRCRAVIFCISPEWLESKYCISEFETAMHVGAAPVGIIVKSVAFADIPGDMTKNYQIVDLTTGGEVGGGARRFAGAEIGDDERERDEGEEHPQSRGEDEGKHGN